MRESGQYKDQNSFSFDGMLAGKLMSTLNALILRPYGFDCHWEN